jgi:hypothetical protein
MRTLCRRWLQRLGAASPPASPLVKAQPLICSSPQGSTAACRSCVRGAPQAATCTVPGVTTVTSGIAVPVQITVATTGSSGAPPLTATPRGAPLDVLRLQWLLVLLYLLAGVMLCVVAAQAFRRWREIGTHAHLFWGGVFVPLMALALCTVTGCGGGGTAAQSAPVTQPVVTPPGTSTITIAITAMTSAGASLPAIAPTQLTLIVN